MSEIIDTVDRDNSLKTVGHISYLLHTVVAVAAVLPGAQASVALLLVAFVRNRTSAGASAPSSSPASSTC